MKHCSGLAFRTAGVVLLAVILLAASLVSVIGASSRGDEEFREAAREIRPETLRAHMGFLAHDLLEGRRTGTRGHEIAALYVASIFDASGLEPGAPDGTYFQRVPLRRPEVAAAELDLVWDTRRQRLRPEEDYAPVGHPIREESRLRAPAVFVDHGVVAPELGVDDYAGVDVAGKIVVTLTGAAPRLEPGPRAHFSSEVLKAENAVARGALGMLSIPPPELLERFPWWKLAEHISEGHEFWLDGAGVPRETAPADLVAAAWLHPDAAAVLFERAPNTLAAAREAIERGDSVAFDLGVDVHLAISTRHSDSQSTNVVARWPGCDPELRDEYVVVTAHLDHVGIGEPADGDAIYNGAYDNASGVATLLAVAQAFAHRPPPRRSVLFVATTAEEEGLVGASYFVAHPAPGVPVANINLDGNLMLFPTRQVMAIGAEHSSLERAVAAVAARLGRQVSPDPQPDRVRFIRSDQYAFVKRGIPALFLLNGFTSADPSIDGPAIIGEWEATVFHTPGDDLDQPMDFGVGASFALLVFELVREVADATARPAWKKGDFFARFAPEPPSAYGSSRPSPDRK